MKKIYILLLTISSGFLFSQVGINTSNPQGIFNVDGAKDNPSSGTPTATQQANDFVITSDGNVGIGTTTPSNKLEIKSESNGALKINDGTQGEGKVLISDADGVGTWKTSSPPVVITSTTGVSTLLGTSYSWVGAYATVTIPGNYLISPNLVTDKTPLDCGQYIAYNLSTSPTSVINQPYTSQDAHFPVGKTNDFIYSSNVGYLQAGTYYMLVRTGTGCSSNITRITPGENSFTLILLK